MAKEKDIIIANHHTGPVVLPRHYNPNPSGDPAQQVAMFEMRTIEPGHTIVIPASEWEVRKASPALQYYLDNRILELVKRDNGTEITSNATVELEIPEHLRPDQDGAIVQESKVGDGVKVAATLRSAKKSSAVVG